MENRLLVKIGFLVNQKLGIGHIIYKKTIKTRRLLREMYTRSEHFKY